MGTALNLLGGLAVFLYGLRVMSNGLQKLAGDRLRAILAALTRNRFTGIIGGFSITAIIQSSSATTVLIVSFANAGLLSLMQAMGLVMGANIGTTITGWLVSIFGFKVSIAAFALPVIGIGFPLSFLAGRRLRQLSEVLVGFGLLFLGLSFLKAGVPTIDASNPADLAKLEFIQQLTGFGFGSILIFVGIGTALTVIIQSSSATMAITLILANQGWIDLELAAAMVLGENLGTTITANLAALGASRNAIRVARFHTLFNLTGVAWMLVAMPFVLDLIPQLIGGNPAEVPGDRATALALFHTIFNITNTFVLVWFAGHIGKLVMRLVPRTDDEKEGPHLSFLETKLLATPELAAVEAKRALSTMAKNCASMFSSVASSLENPRTTRFGSLLDQLTHEEQTTDEMEEEIVAYCTQLVRTGTSERVGEEVTLLLESVDELENIGDRCLKVGHLSARRNDLGLQFGEDGDRELGEMLTTLSELLALTVSSLDPEHPQIEIARAQELTESARGLRDESRASHSLRMWQAESESKEKQGPGDPDVRAQLLFFEIMDNLRDIADYAWRAETAVRRTTLAS